MGPSFIAEGSIHFSVVHKSRSLSWMLSLKFSLCWLSLQLRGECPSTKCGWSEGSPSICLVSPHHNASPAVILRCFMLQFVLLWFCFFTYAAICFEEIPSIHSSTNYRSYWTCFSVLFQLQSSWSWSLFFIIWDKCLNRKTDIRIIKIKYLKNKKQLKVEKSDVKLICTHRGKSQYTDDGTFYDIFHHSLYIIDGIF